MGQKEIFSLGTLFQNKIKNIFKNLYIKCISFYNNINKSNIHIIYYQNNLITSSEKL